MSMFARFDEIPAMTFQDKGNKTLRSDARTDGQRENSILSTNKVCGGIITFKELRALRGQN